MKFLIFFLFPFFLSAEAIILDPLLQKPWIPDAEEEEKRSYYRFLNQFPQKESTIVKQDIFGRKYLVTPSGQRRFVLDDQYKKEFPFFPDADLAASETKALFLARKEKETVFLGKGALLCFRLKQEKEPGFFPSWVKEVNQFTNEATNLWSDKNLPLDLVADPYGCYLESNGGLGNLILESESFRYRLEIPKSLRYEGLFGDRLGVYGENRDSLYRMVRFVEFLDPYLGPGETEWEEAYRLYVSQQKKKRRPKIIFSLGTTFDKSPRLRNATSYFSFWDEIRSLQKSVQRQLQFRREEKPGGDYLSQWVEVDETGNPILMEMWETYFFRSPRGFFLSLSYPKREKKKADEYWTTIRKGFRIKE